jgi:hypothetical protein
VGLGVGAVVLTAFGLRDRARRRRAHAEQQQRLKQGEVAI